MEISSFWASPYVYAFRLPEGVNKCVHIDINFEVNIEVDGVVFGAVERVERAFTSSTNEPILLINFPRFGNRMVSGPSKSQLIYRAIRMFLLICFQNILLAK